MKKMKRFTDEWWFCNIIGVAGILGVIVAWEMIRLCAWCIYYLMK